jgi:hypothetical protein
VTTGELSPKRKSATFLVARVASPPASTDTISVTPSISRESRSRSLPRKKVSGGAVVIEISRSAPRSASTAPRPA